MEDGRFEAMTIHVEDGKLKCSPRGRGLGYDLVYEGVNPFAVDKWQHISCIFHNQRYTKGQYLAVNIDSEDTDREFERAIGLPISFGIGANDPFIATQQNWSLILANDVNFS